jgi:VCBS repeat-containing protein
VTVQGANDKPVAQSDAVSVSEDGAIVGRNFTATDVDVENLTYAIVGTAPAGLTLNGNGTWNYTPPAATYQSLDDTETATVIFQYKANDGTADSDPKTVTITITGANDAPVAQNNSVSVSEDGALTGKSVIATDADIETLTYALTAPALDGLTFNTDGTWSYTPPASYQSLATGQSATISFQYNAYDGTAYSNTATQTIVIQGANDAPVARPDTGAMLENQGTTEFNVRGNDTLDPDSGAPNTITTGPVTVYAGGSYGLDANDVSVVATADGLQVSLIGTDWDKLARNNTITMTVNYTLVGDQGLNGSNQLTLTVTGVNDAPVLDATKTPTLTVDEDAPAPTSGVGTAISNFIDLVGGGGLDNVTDVDNTVTGIAITGVNTAAGTWYYSATGTGWTTITAVSDTNALLLTPDFRLYFRPNADYSGTIEDALTFRAWDRSIGTPGQYGDATTNGGSSAFSSATDTIRVVVNGDNDPAVISGATTGNVTEDATPNTVTGDLNSTDPDGTNDSWQAVTAATATTSGWGTYTIDATGHWAYTLNNSNATVDALPTGGQLTDSFTVRTEDGTSQVVTVTITGANDAAVISGSTAGTVAEDATPNTATGALTVTDPDTGQAVFAAQNATAGTYGTFSINAAGAWTYTLNNANATVDALKPSEHLMETFTVASADGTAMQQVQITINGTNDAPVLTRTNGISASGSEDSNFDNLLSSFMNPGSPVDPDGGAIGVAITKTDASHGTWYWSADHSVWTAIETNVSDSHALLLNTNYFVRFVPFADYNGNIPQALIFRAWDHTSGTAGTYADASVNGGSTAFSSETKPVSFNISPLNDPAVISGTTSGAVTEDATPNTATGDLNSTDVDGTADAWQTVATATATASNYGTYTLDATGHWVYTLNNANPTVNGLAAAATLTDTFTARTADGTSQIVTVTITGTNDAPTIGGTTTRTVTEDGTLTATGTLTISDVDTGESSFRPQSNIAGLYGTFSLSANGTWNYALNNSLPVIQALPGGAQLFDTFTAVSFDGSSQQQVQVNITGLNDVPTATGVRLGTVKEDTTLTATGKRDIIDVDTGESAFVPHVATTGTYGTFSLNSDGTWNYVLNNGSVAVQSLSEGQTANDTFFAYAVDLSGFTVINITVQGTNDVAIISGTTTGAITEDAAPNTATGDLNSTDVDGTADAWQAVTAATATANGYGTYTIDATGHWVFALDNANPTVNGLAAGATLTDTFTAKTADGTTQVVTVTITGATDATTVITAGNLALGIGGFKIIGQNAEDMAGISVASAGDINNDGYADIMVGAYGNSSGGIGTGAAYVIYGKAAAFTAIDLDDVAAGNGGFKIDGEGVNDWAGRSVASAGDLNGDGYDDMIVGASNQQGKGAAYVVYGRETPFGAINLDDVALGTGGFKISGEFNADQFGTSVASAGDINGDGFDDIIVGASSNFAGGTNAGAAYVIYGKAAPITSVNMADVTAGNGGFKITGERSGDYAGLDVSSAGDVNGDGYADLIVGAYNNDGNGTDSGAAYIVFGKASAISAINLDNIAVGQGGFKIIAESAYDYVGFSVAAAGDLNGDGIDDVVVGAHAAYGDNTSFGAAYVVYGTATGPSSINLSNIALGNGGFRILGETGNGAFGYNVASAGDVNGDGYLDLIVGGLMTDGSSKAYVVYGSGNTITSLDMDNVALGQGSFSIVGLNAFDYFGTNASSAGDLNGDGFDDLIIGAKNDNAGGSQAGAAYIVYGGQNLPNNAASHIAGTAAGTVTEDGTATVGGALTVTQANQLAGTFAAANLTGSYGSFAVLANGTWTYTLNNGNSTVNALNNGQHLTEKFNVLSADGTATETVTVTINGHTDPVVTVSVTEDVTHVFTATDFAQTAGGFQGVTVDPMSNAAGKLMLGNVAFASATFVTAAQIAAGMLTWAPADNVYGTAGDAEIAFRVRDNAGVDSATSQATALDMSATNYFDDTASMSLYQIPMTGANQSYVRNGTAPTFSLQSSGAQLSSFELLRSDNNLEISWSALDGNGRTLTLLNHFDGGSSAFNAFSPLAFTVDGYSIGGSSYNLATGPTAPDGSRYAIAGSAASETLSGNSGLDLLFGGGGDDIVNGGAGNDYLSGGAGNDTLTGGDGIDSMIGGDGDDTFIYTHTAGTVAEIYDGGTGYDTLVGSTGNTTRLNFSAIRDVEAFTMPSGGSDGETLYLTAAQWAGFGSISMGGGSDTMVTIMSGDMDVSAMGIASISGVGMREFHDTTGNDMLTITGAQFDALVSNGYMTLNQGGNDTLYLTSTSAVLNSIADNTSLTGLETISGEKATSSINISLQAGQTEAVKVTGSAFDDTLGGGSGNDTINGGDGHDTITGGNGNDFLLGDIGADILTGGTGADTFAYTATSQGGDTVKDFMSDDMIGIFRDLLGVTDTGALQSDGTTVAGNTVLFESVGSASAAAQNNSAKLIYDSTNHDLYYDSDGGASSSARILLAHLEAGTLDASHIMLMA